MLPTPLRVFKKTLRILKSSLSPNQIALSFALGLFAGLPPMGLHVLLPCSMALILRVSLRGFLWSIALWKLLSLAVSPGAFALGKWLLDPARGLDGLWRRVTAWPVLAPMDYNRYLLLGSQLISLLIAIPVFFVVRNLVFTYRNRVSVRLGSTRAAERFRR
ncbi:TIGR03546 family protein, partial [Candidatus Bipolaricaulota bacterium]|nr:TIGR03546 family protein [Candidatus Bipolaricaulota bacterium]